MYDFDHVFCGQHSVENFESVTVHDVPRTFGMLVTAGAASGCRLANSTAAKMAAMTLAAP
jgi:hypothetical protein